MPWPEPAVAQRPWPGHAFVRHFSRPVPWRALTLPQRRRLLCLAASSGHAPSLEAALAQCGCTLTPDVLTAAAAAGDIPACQRVLGESDVIAVASLTAAARNGHLQLLKLLLDATGARDTPYAWKHFVKAAATGACLGGQAAVLAWLQQAHGYRVMVSDMAAAATVGQGDLFERVLLPQLMPGFAGVAAAAVAVVGSPAAAAFDGEPLASAEVGASAGAPAGEAAGTAAVAALKAAAAASDSETDSEPGSDFGTPRNLRVRMEALIAAAYGLPAHVLRWLLPLLWPPIWRPLRPLTAVPQTMVHGAADDSTEREGEGSTAQREALADIRSSSGSDGDQGLAAEGAETYDNNEGSDSDGYSHGSTYGCYRTDSLRRLLSAATGSPTPCWAAKLDILCAALGPSRTQVLDGDDRSEVQAVMQKAARQPHFVARLQRLLAVFSMPLDTYVATEAAMQGGHANALEWLWGEAGGHGAGGSIEMVAGRRWVDWYHSCWGRGAVTAPGHLEVLRLLRSRGSAVFDPADVAHEAAMGAGVEVLTWLLQAAAAEEDEEQQQGLRRKKGEEGGEKSREKWSRALAEAAREGSASVVLLRALRARGAAIDLGAVACGGSVEALEWAVAELEVEQDGGVPKSIALNLQQQREVERSGNTAAMDWLRAQERPPELTSLPRAKQPWPGPAFVRHWSRPEPWRALTLPQRRRLLCLAASSGHAPSLEAALAHCGCSAMPGALAAAALAGDTDACLQLGGRLDSSAFYGPAASGHARARRACLYIGRTELMAAAARSIDITLLLIKAVRNLNELGVASLLEGACAGGNQFVTQHVGFAYTRFPNASHAVAAAKAGQVSIVDRLLPTSLFLGELFRPPPANGADAAAAQEQAHQERERQQRSNRWALLRAMLFGCTLEVVSRHFERLSQPPPGQLAAAQPRAAAAAAAAAATRPGGSGALQHHRDASPAALDAWLAEARGLLAAALRSRTRCWLDKVHFLLSTWGPNLTRQVVRRQPSNAAEDRTGSERLLAAAYRQQPEMLTRVRLAHADGLQCGYAQAVREAAQRGDAGAMAYLWDECGVPVQLDRLSVTELFLGWGHAAVLQLLAQRGYRFTADDVVLEAARQSKRVAGDSSNTSSISSSSSTISQSGPDAALLWLTEEAARNKGAAAAGLTGVVEVVWRVLLSVAFTHAARRGASLQVLRALREQAGAAIDLAAVAAGGSEEGVAWAVAELGMEASRTALQGDCATALLSASSNEATLGWLQRAGLMHAAGGAG
ncbi:hypothetical protein HXX76_002321 [Chlamydomonas incerta]|uniref:Uncharacterized protein n=1 Tax=Chlamydomonas incerta TaxID=51695 RepID=A0A835SNF0_CHLIN|nr:hypothetical protein HXX76_002321 [Chlamydomonas incerta]|eukprot:KAG2423096.1 hypothetical protein HXX76_002321 [Chlamydomonas incerta]